MYSSRYFAIVNYRTIVLWFQFSYSVIEIICIPQRLSMSVFPSEIYTSLTNVAILHKSIKFCLCVKSPFYPLISREILFGVICCSLCEHVHHIISHCIATCSRLF
nr:MAG TPA: hypothetical protein [Bacteriophage sp.]